MKKKGVEQVIKQDLFGKKQKLIQVQSFTRPEKYYEINPEEKTCTCLEFTRSKNKLPCKHLRYCLDIKAEGGFSVSILKSALQKNIRRCEVEGALKIAKVYMRKNPNDFFRRICIIAIEDTILHPEYRRLVELSSISARKSYQLDKETEHFAMTVVEQLAKCQYSDYDYESFKNGYKSINSIPYIDWEELGKAEKELVMSIKWREKMGSMVGDRLMLSYSTRIWSHRLKSKEMTIKKLKKIYDDIPVRKSYDDIGTTLTVNDIPLVAIDFHNSPIINILMNKQYVLDLLERYYPKDVLAVDERIKSIIWMSRSGVSYKQDYFTGEKMDLFAKPHTKTPEVSREKYEAIFNSLEAEINNIAIWFLEKNK